MNMLEFAKDVLIDAGDVFGSHGTQIVMHKAGVGNYVTEKDLAIDRFIIDRIHSTFPTHTILSEESALPSVSKDTDDLWILDPLDGTTNAACGVPHYGISLAFMHKGEVVIGVILDMPNNTLYWAEKDQGAFLQNRLSTQPVALHTREGKLADTLVCTGAPYTREDFVVNWTFMNKVHAAGARLLILGSAVIASCYVAEGKLSLYYEVGLKPWDIAAASLIIREAGGIATAIEGLLDVLAPQTFVCGGNAAVEEFQILVTRPV
jgi:myo-inositol-1(or 4)-monophosphatase